MLLDNAPAHPKDLTSDCGRIVTIFLPPGVTSVLQPQDQGVISAFKRTYRQMFVAQLSNSSDFYKNPAISIEDTKQRLQNYTLLHAVRNMAEAWEGLSVQTLVNGWKPLLDICCESIPDSNDVPNSNEWFANQLDVDVLEIQRWFDEDGKNLELKMHTELMFYDSKPETEPYPQETVEKIDITEAKSGLDHYLDFCTQHMIDIPGNIIDTLKGSLKRFESTDENDVSSFLP